MLIFLGSVFLFFSMILFALTCFVVGWHSGRIPQSPGLWNPKHKTRGDSTPKLHNRRATRGWCTGRVHIAHTSPLYLLFRARLRSTEGASFPWRCVQSG
jgi:hypothetical protein